jgi:amino acid adenylation domain-containing protein
VRELEQEGGSALVPSGGSAASEIALIWCEVLGAQAVGTEADFFELGGDSLAAVRMLAALEERMSVQISFTDFLEASNVEALASAVARERVSLHDRPPASAPEDATHRHAPLSYAQERLWFLEQLGRSSAAYNMPIGIRLRTTVDVEAMQRALQDVISRHDALRTRFTTEDGRTVAVTRPAADTELDLIDLTGEAAAEIKAQRILSEFVSRPFDLERHPLVRAALVRLGEEDHILELVFHHIVCDGCSQSVVLRELGALYEAYRTGRAAALGTPGIQYGDFARRQRAAVEAQGLDGILAPWLERLAGVQEVLELPIDRPRPPMPGDAGATHRVRLAPAMVTAVRRFAKDARATPFATLLSAYCVLLYRHSGQQDLVIGATTAGREHQELETGVGLFANTVALRCDLSLEPSFQELVARVRETVLWAVAHDRAPLQEIVARLPLERHADRHPLFQVFCAQVPLATLEVDGGEPYDAYPTTSRFDLTLFIEEEADGELELAWEYSTDLFDAGTIERMARRYVRLLEDALDDPRRSIEDLQLLDAEEREEAIAAGRESGHEYPLQCMHNAFERWAAAAPDAVAVTFEGRSLTYAQLNARSNRLAHRLIRLGAGPETLVALFLEPSLELVASILGVLKAGAAYLPLDPEHPRERLDFVLADATAKLIVTDSRLLERLGEVDAMAVCLDEEGAALEALSSANPATAVVPENLSYVIYTSGSTGRPKGVQVEHRQVARLFSATDEWFGFGPQDVWILLHSYSFDFSVWELWGALAHGGQLVVSPVSTTRSPPALATLVAGHGVTVLNATPSLFTAIQHELLRHAAELAVRLVVFGGEALRPPALRPWFERYGDGGPTLVNMYGITETTVHVTYRPLRADDCQRETSPVGVPIPDLSVFVLDGKGMPVPGGVSGELYVGGAGVTRGYLNRPELTADRFIDNPFGSGRLYRTGDVAARLPDGQLEFRGRSDDQVKIRGFRIELGEIEGTIREHPGVSDCAVAVIEVAPGDERLAAYVVADRADDAAVITLPEAALAHLKQRLPSYMIPASVTLLERIPLTRNGKIDRRALPAPARERVADAEFLEPETQTERTVAEVWQEVLGAERVGAEDNFFNLGGHSLLAARVVTQVRKRCAVEISVRALFDQPTLRRFAAAVDSAERTDAEPQPAPDPASRYLPDTAGPHSEGATRPALRARDTYPLSFPQQQLLFFDELAPGSVTYNAALAWRVIGPLEMSALESALGELFRRQEALRTVLVWGANATPSQVVLDEWEVELPVIDLSELTGEERDVELARLLTEHARRPFDLARELTLRTAVFRLDSEHHVILFAPHHVAFDAWAVEVLYREVGELYAAALERRDAELPELPLQYRDFATWQRERLQGELLRSELDFWRTHLAGAPTVMRLPAARARAGAQSFDGATHTFALDSELTETVRNLCAATGVTPYMLLLAAFGTLLYRWNGQDDILFGGPMTNRQRSGLEHLIGFFANTVVVRVRLGGNPTFHELLKRVRESVLASYEHQEVPLELVVEAVRPQRDPAVHPLFQVNFRVTVGDIPRFELPATRTKPVGVDLGLARFELALELHVLEERIEAELNYNVALFDRATVERLAGDFESVLRRLSAEPNTRLLGVQLPSEEASMQGAGAPASTMAAIRHFRRAGTS